MAQTVIVRRDLPPVEAMVTGKDQSICGDCPHRYLNLGSCYVNVGRFPLTIWHAYKRGLYPSATGNTVKRLLRGLSVRLGAYGDPAAVPLRVWLPVVRAARRWTGYTHLWRTCDPCYRRILMASCDNTDDQAAAAAMGWRTFRVRTEAEPLLPGEKTCPASKEAGQKTTCLRCGRCCGTGIGRRTGAPNIAIMVHGATARRFITTRDGQHSFR